MKLKDLENHIKKVVHQMPFDLCKLNPESISLNQITIFQESTVRTANLIDLMWDEINTYSETVRKLLDHINIIQGEQGKPLIRAQVKNTSNNMETVNNSSLINQLYDNIDNGTSKSYNDISSENERKVKEPKKPRRTNQDLTIHDTQKVEFDKTKLPTDAVFKGYKKYTIQDVKLYSFNTLFLLEEYYSPSTGKSYIAEMPINNRGSHFGSNLKALIIALYYNGNMTEPGIHRFLTSTTKLKISLSTISRFLTDDIDIISKEKQDIVQTGMELSPYIQMDDTSARVNGQNHYLHILCSQYFISYFTEENKDKFTLLNILTQGNVLHTFNDTTLELLSMMNVSVNVINLIKDDLKPIMSTLELKEVLCNHLNNKYPQAQKNIIEASAISYYRHMLNALQILVSDDAPQFKMLTKILSLCWVHIGRHFKKLNPLVPDNQIKTKIFINEFWNYYHKLLVFKDSPNSYKQLTLSYAFDELFSTVTGFDELDQRIAKTKIQKENLLVVLDNPEVPLHNNHSELVARAQAIRRDVSSQTQNQKGTTAKDAWMTISRTARLYYVNFYHYTIDLLFSKERTMSLSKKIRESASCVDTT